METVRNFRILFPPSVLLGMVLLAEWLNGCLWVELAELGEKNLLTAVAGVVAAALIPVGFAIGGITLLIQWFVFCLFFRKDYQLVLKMESVERLWPLVKLPRIPDKDSALYGAQVFSHQLDEWLVAYMDRLWDTANGYAGALLALFIALGWFWAADRPWNSVWGIVALVLAVIFVLIIWRARREIARIVNFHIEHPRPKEKKNAKHNSSRKRARWAQRA